MISVGKLKLEDNKDLYYAMKENCDKQDKYEDISNSNIIFDDENNYIWICFY